MLKMRAFFKRVPLVTSPQEISALFVNHTVPLFVVPELPPNKLGSKKKLLAPPSFEELEAAKHYLNAWSPLGVWRQCHCVCNM